MITVADFVGAQRYGVRFSSGDSGRANYALRRVGGLIESRHFSLPVGVGCGWCTAPVAERGATIAEGDEPDERTSDNSPGRLLALSDGVFAIAMTLLALDLRLPDLGTDPSDAQLRHALGDDWNGYLAFVISFYVVANYWGVHRRRCAP